MAQGVTTTGGTTRSRAFILLLFAVFVSLLPPAAALSSPRAAQAAQTGEQIALTNVNVSPLSTLSLPESPWVSQLVPSSVPAGSGDLSLLVLGSGFAPTTKVLWMGVAMSTIYNSSTSLTALIPAALLARPWEITVSVTGASYGVTFYVDGPAPTITALDPAYMTVGGPSASLGVTGTNFAYRAFVEWGGAPGGVLQGGRDSETHITATVNAYYRSFAQNVTITVRNRTGGPVSNSFTFVVGNAIVPSVASIDPATVWVGYVMNVVLTVRGANYVSGSHITLNSVEKTTTSFVSASQLSVPLTTADMATAGTVYVAVKNPAWTGGGSSMGLPLLVQGEATDPLVTITGADSGWHNAPVPLSFAASDSQSGVQKVQYMASPVVPTWTDGTSYTVPASTQGRIRVEVRALDWCNRVGTAGAMVNIDTTQPRTATLGNVSVTRGKTAMLKFRVSEPSNLSPTAKVVLKAKAARGNRAATIGTLKSVPMNAKQAYSFKCTLAPGTYRWYVYATDLAGNTQRNVANAMLTVK